MSALTKLKLANASRKPVEETPEERMRNRMVAHLTEQLAMATALIECRSYTATRTVTKKNDDGSAVTVERDKRLRPWYWHDLSGKWFLELRYANTVLSLAKDQNAIEVGTKDKLVPTIQTVVEAVKAGELDAAMNAALASRKKANK
ncbi:DUF6641 family protein [Magnetospirillum sp. 15-1]|uniref:DUF6641 family protein n=1 Tax=Magnetospirillum sp. 15-1 TaxID=1979370 RepID=UPI000BBC8E6C|nr:DUF6641 family protein [Magnetospirillum sp. 15-1]